MRKLKCGWCDEYLGVCVATSLSSYHILHCEEPNSELARELDVVKGGGNGYTADNSHVNLAPIMW